MIFKLNCFLILKGRKPKNAATHEVESASVQHHNDADDESDETAATVEAQVAPPAPKLLKKSAATDTEASSSRPARSSRRQTVAITSMSLLKQVPEEVPTSLEPEAETTKKVSARKNPKLNASIQVVSKASEPATKQSKRLSLNHSKLAAPASREDEKEETTKKASKRGAKSPQKQHDTYKYEEVSDELTTKKKSRKAAKIQEEAEASVDTPDAGLSSWI